VGERPQDRRAGGRVPLPARPGRAVARDPGLPGLWSCRPLPEGPVDPADAAHLETGGVHADHSPTVDRSIASCRSPGSDGRTGRSAGDRTRAHPRPEARGSSDRSPPAASTSPACRSPAPTAGASRSGDPSDPVLDPSGRGASSPPTSTPASSGGIASATPGDDRPLATATPRRGRPDGPAPREEAESPSRAEGERRRRPDGPEPVGPAARGASELGRPDRTVLGCRNRREDACPGGTIHVQMAPCYQWVSGGRFEETTRVEGL
jgi:hypothetical protein